MFEIELINLKTNQKFTKSFWSKKLKNNFINKCKYSKKVKVIGILDYSHLYD